MRRSLTTALTTAAAAALLLAGAAMPSAALAKGSSSGKLTVSPAKGTPAASPDTQISILGIKPNRIKSVKLVGSESGDHPGKMRKYSGKRGASFLPTDPLLEGESASVDIRFKGRKPVKYSFTVADLGPPQPTLNLPFRQESKLHHFVTEPDLSAPRMTVNKYSPKTSRGKIFLTPLPSPVVHPGSDNTISINPVGPGGPMIVNSSGAIVWFRQLEMPEVAANLSLQKYHGRKVLTWWQGTVTPSAFGHGVGMIANNSYRTIDRVEAGNGYGMDLHEFKVTNSGDAFFTIYSPILVHLPGTPEGKLSPLLDSIVQQVDIRTGLVVWEWHSYGHIPLEESYANPENSSANDAFHINSIQPLGKGKVLISARDTSALYKIDRASGRIIWTLGGKASDFKLKKGARFDFQHDARMLGNGDISLFDDSAGPPQKRPYSRGLVLSLNMKKRTAKVVDTYHRDNSTSAQSEGSVQKLPGGNTFVGFGSEPYYSEFSPDGRLLFDARLPIDDGSYRTFRFPWTGTPKTRPIAAAVPGDGTSVAVYASWNGATKVRRWQVLAGESGGPFEPIAKTKKGGFETRIVVPGTASRYKVRALDKNGKALATSRAVSAP